MNNSSCNTDNDCFSGSCGSINGNKVCIPTNYCSENVQCPSNSTCTINSCFNINGTHNFRNNTPYGMM